MEERLNVQHLTETQVARIEDAMNTDDLEQMVAVVDDLIRLHIAKALKVAELVK